MDYFSKVFKKLNGRFPKLNEEAEWSNNDGTVNIGKKKVSKQFANKVFNKETENEAKHTGNQQRKYVKPLIKKYFGNIKMMENQAKKQTNNKLDSSLKSSSNWNTKKNTVNILKHQINKLDKAKRPFEETKIAHNSNINSPKDIILDGTPKDNKYGRELDKIQSNENDLKNLRGASNNAITVNNRLAEPKDVEKVAYHSNLVKDSIPIKNLLSITKKDMKNIDNNRTHNFNHSTSTNNIKPLKHMNFGNNQRPNSKMIQQNLFGGPTR